MKKTHYLDCPFCKATLEVDAVSGKLVNKWEGGRKDKPAQERFSDAVKQIEEGKKKRDEFFSSAHEHLKEKRKLAEKLFGESLKKVKDEGLDEPPLRPFDLD
ncbi:MAG: hypothetical protein HY747_01640 [Elusimicrobia bacterium]|nr:hypothetical protein [Elusimicrobiota bacterium]